MSFLNCLKSMDVKIMDEDTVIYKTDRLCEIIGYVFLAAGVLIFAQLMMPGSIIMSMYGVYIIFCLVMGGLFLLLGLSLICYHKIVKIDKKKNRIEIDFNSILATKKTTIPFSSISDLEIAKTSDCVCGMDSSLFCVRIYYSSAIGFNQHTSLRVEEIFSSVNEHDVMDVVDNFSNVCNIEVFNSYRQERRLSFSN